ncbi:MAG: YfiR family protein [Verrucomicrobiae bacterium]|nr:YfiR family protein [Verrucomicrobiae bacterium]
MVTGWAHKVAGPFAGRWLGILLLSLLVAGNAPGQSKEYQIKATFLFNFAQFIDWPPAAFGGADAPFCIGILGDDPFGNYLDETVRGEKIGSHPLVVQRCRHVEEATNCQVLFVSRSEAKKLKEVFAGLKNQAVLTVGEVDGFCKDGGVIRFVAEQNKIHFRISPEAVKKASLTASSKLLRLAEIVPPGGD